MRKFIIINGEGFGKGIVIRMRRIGKGIVVAVAALTLALAACGQSVGTTSGMSGADIEIHESETVTSTGAAIFSLDEVPEYSGAAYVSVNGNEPYFSISGEDEESFEVYSELDSLGRCGEACASVGTDLMPTEKREAIGSVKPTGWHTVKYDFVDGKYLYNRCHLIGYQLSGENANEKNLITGTRYMNTEGMLPFENMVADYVKETENHVRYRVTPIFDGDDLVASGVLMEAESVEDGGEGILYCVYVYNVQPGVDIDYATGDSEQSLATSLASVDQANRTTGTVTDTGEVTYVLNTNSMKFHVPDCESVADIREWNRKDFAGTREEAIAQGYAPCKRCNP